MKLLLVLGAALMIGLTNPLSATAQDMSNGADNFYKSDKVTLQKVSFKNQYQMTIVGNLFVPKNMSQNTKNPAIVVGHPMGATKEQTSNLYAQKMAEQGFVTLAIDQLYWGESSGSPRNAVAPDMYAESFSAAVDYLDSKSFVDKERIGVLGICASGSFVISAAKIDSRMKAIATVNMYDMGEIVRTGLGHSQTLEQRKGLVAGASNHRDVVFAGGQDIYIAGTTHTLDANTDPIQREFYDFYRTPRGEFTPAGSSPEKTTHGLLSNATKFLNFYPINDIESISPRPLLFVVGEQAHSKEFSENAYKRASEPKELYVVPNAGHVDLYDRVELIPFDKLTSFFNQYLK